MAAPVHEAPFPGVPDRRLWVMDTVGTPPERLREVHAATWQALDADYAGTGPEGLLILTDQSDRSLEWADPRTIFVGHAPGGRLARVAYFTAARTAPYPGWPPHDPPYRILEFATQTEVTTDDIVSLWISEEILTADEARRRISEVLLVAVDATGAPIGVATRYLEHNGQLGLDLWNVRAFVAAQHRRSTVATALALGARDHLEATYASGRDRRAPGILFEVENPALKRAFHAAVWNEVGVALIGENARGDHVRVYYFAGARVP